MSKIQWFRDVFQSESEAFINIFVIVVHRSDFLAILESFFCPHMMRGVAHSP